MIGKQKLEELTKKAIAKGKNLGATQVEVVVWNGTEELTRFANNEIHQSVSLTDSTTHVRAIIGKKIGVARGDDLLAVVKTAVEIAKIQQLDEHFKSLPKPAKYKQFASDRVHLGAQGRAKAIARIITAGRKAKLSLSGAFSESEGEMLVANSLGVANYHASKSADLSVIATGKNGSGYAGQTAKGGTEIDVAQITQRVIERATLGGAPKEIPAGEYEVILEPPAVAELLDFFSWLGPNGRVYHEEVSFMQGNMGKKVFDPKLTITDDPWHKDIFPIGFDLEGFPKKPLPIVSGGALKNVAYDSYHAAKYKKRNTGHGQLAPNTWGPIPTHLTIAPGDREIGESVKRVKRGILVTRFWYTRVVNHKELMLTGMTRDGTFLIENGKITARLLNLRYTESVLSAFKNIKGIGNKLQLEGSEGFPSLVPHLHLAKFNFTGVAKHS
ncbi:TldD/PmbA family protein [Candidatus Microgenomates bacterium]|nr:TldD/PmbA family protein [Candidatus Microgenomates bacterium]